jgi:hypothetical protein
VSTSRSYTAVLVYRPAYYYYSYTYNNYIYVGAYYGYDGTSSPGKGALIAFLVPFSIAFLAIFIILISAITGKNTGMTCCESFFCIFCCQCHYYREA